MAKESNHNSGDLGSTPGSGKSPGIGKATTPVFLLRESHGQKSLGGYSPKGHKESDMTEQISTKYVHAHKDRIFTWSGLEILEGF